MLNPIQGIITSTMDAFKDEALSRLKTFAELKKMYDEIGALTLLSIKLQGNFERYKNANVEIINNFINAANKILRTLQTFLEIDIDYKSKFETAVNKAKIKMKDEYARIDWNKRQRVLTEHEITKAHEVLKYNYNVISERIQILEDGLNGFDDNIKRCYANIQIYEEQIELGESKVKESVEDITTRKAILMQTTEKYTPIIQWLTEAKNNFITNHKDLLNKKMQELSDLLNAKQAQLWIELEQFKARLNSPSTPKAKTKKEL